MVFEKGKSACEGVAIGEVFLYRKNTINIDKIEIEPEKVVAELEKLVKALKESKEELKSMKKNLVGKVSKDELEILVSQIIMLDDPVFIKDIEKLVLKERVNVEYAVKIVSEKYFELFSKMKDPVYSQRGLDVKDISERILKKIIVIDEEVWNINGKIVVANEILPSQLLKAMDYGIEIKGIVLEYGGVTSHVAILAKTFNIPTLMGVQDVSNKQYGHNKVILDSRKNNEKFILKPTNEELDFYEKLVIQFKKEKNELEKLERLEAISKDGVRINLKINIGSSKELKEHHKDSVDGVGLYRTELMYMESKDFPCETQLMRDYKEVVDLIGEDKEIIIRTLDIGADKMLPYCRMAEEENPFLGIRGVRYSLRNRGVFKSQIRGILRASYKTKIKIMYPMVTNCKEILEIKAIVEECKNELEREKIPYNKDIEQGIMIEVPSAVVMAEEMLRYVDFFSIGTNDLTQYVLAADRMAENLEELYDSYDPAVLKMIDYAVGKTLKSNKSICVCGEMAGEEIACLIFLSMGIRELSMVKSSVQKIKKIIRNLDVSKLVGLREDVLKCETSKEVRERVELEIKNIIR